MLFHFLLKKVDGISQPQLGSSAGYFSAYLSVKGTSFVEEGATVTVMVSLLTGSTVVPLAGAEQTVI